MARLLIAGGVLFDGAADTLRRADVLIEGDAIVEVGPELSGEAMRIDASGKWVVPGVIDMHVHLWNLGMEVLPALVGCRWALK